MDLEATGMSEVSSAPVELLALDEPYEGGHLRSPRRRAELLSRAGRGDAIMAALPRGVDLVVPAIMFAEMRDSFPPELPPYIRVR